MIFNELAHLSQSKSYVKKLTQVLVNQKCSNLILNDSYPNIFTHNKLFSIILQHIQKAVFIFKLREKRHNFPLNPQSFSNYLKCQLHCKRHSWLMQPYSTQSTSAALSLVLLMNHWCFLGYLSEKFMFSVIPCLLFSPWLTRSSPQRTLLLLICKPQKDISSWMPASKHQRTIGKQLQLLFTRGTLTVGTVPWGGRGNKRCINLRWFCVLK